MHAGVGGRRSFHDSRVHVLHSSRQGAGDGAGSAGRYARAFLVEVQKEDSFSPKHFARKHHYLEPVRQAFSFVRAHRVSAFIREDSRISWFLYGIFVGRNAGDAIKEKEKQAGFMGIGVL